MENSTKEKIKHDYLMLLTLMENYTDEKCKELTTQVLDMEMLTAKDTIDVRARTVVECFKKADKNIDAAIFDLEKSLADLDKLDKLYDALEILNDISAKIYQSIKQ